MNPDPTSPLKSPAWILHHASEQELLAHLHDLLEVQQHQSDEITGLVQSITDENIALRHELELAETEAWHLKYLLDTTPPRTNWMAVGLAGLAGYVLGRDRDR